VREIEGEGGERSALRWKEGAPPSPATARPRPHTPPFPLQSLAGVASVDPFLVEYYRTLSGGLPKELFRAALFTPAAPKGPRPKNFKERE
jgi:hypothetical protein